MEVSDIHKRLMQLLKERNMTKYRLAAKMGIRPTAIYNMFSRKTMPKLEFIEHICQTLDITLSEFFLFTIGQKNVGCVSDEEIDFLETYRALTDQKKQESFDLLSTKLEKLF